MVGIMVVCIVAYCAIVALLEPPCPHADRVLVEAPSDTHFGPAWVSWYECARCHKKVDSWQ